MIGEDGRMNAAAGERVRGPDRGRGARRRWSRRCASEGRLRGEEPYTHSVPFSERSGERIEPLISLQWFCRMDELAAPAIEVVERDEVRIVPDNYKRVYLDWMRNIRPWCVSRQLWWGHRMPVWYGPDGEEIVAESEAAAREAARRARASTRTRCARRPTSSTPGSARRCGRSRPSAGPTRPRYLRAFYPTSFLTTAREIIFLWVARMVMMGIEFAGDIPFRDVYVHPVIQAPDGRRMSKSLGTGIDPLDEIDVHGADALRFGLLAMSSTQDVRYSAERVQQGRDLANKMWNASRLILLNAEATPEPRAERRSRTAGSCRGCSARSPRVAGGIDAYDFAHAALGFYSFFWSELCDWYLEIVKPRLYDGDEDAAANLLYVLERVLALAHPVMPFVTEEIWGYLPDREALLIVSRVPEPPTRRSSTRPPRRRSSAAIDTVRERAPLARPRRASPPGACSTRGSWSAPSRPSSSAAWRGCDLDGARRRGRWRRSARSRSSPRTRSTPSRRASASSRAPRAAASREVERAERKLGNEGFVAKAPAEVVEAEREKLDRYRRRAGRARARRSPGLDAPNRRRRTSARSSRSGCGSGSSGSGGWSRCSGMPQHRFASIHVVGTNGKSSVTEITAALLEAHGMSAGAYLSPHDERWRERMRIGGAEIEPEAFGAAVERVAQAVTTVDRTLDEGESVTQFEADTATAFVALAAAGVEVGGDRGRARRPPRRHQRAPVAGHRADLGRARAHRVARRHRARDRGREARRAARPHRRW